MTIRVSSAPQMAGDVADDFGLAYAWVKSGSQRLGEVHRVTITSLELKKQSPRWIYSKDK